MLSLCIKTNVFKCVLGTVVSLTEQKESWMECVGEREWKFIEQNSSKKDQYVFDITFLKLVLNF